ncbi:hypothetical protein HY448_01660 [Candidatus Pacearchaeota archaeon]|nr:hypothetical protein [Candidatus Pacearchaeota archaeon]
MVELWRRPIKLYIWSEQKMSLEGHHQWNEKLRGFTRKLVYKPEMRLDVHYSQIDTLDKIKMLCEDLLGVGVWVVRSLSRGKTKTRWKWVRLAKVIVMKHGDDYRSTIENTGRLKRYKFFKN